MDLHTMSYRNLLPHYRFLGRCYVTCEALLLFCLPDVSNNQNAGLLIFFSRGLCFIKRIYPTHGVHLLEKMNLNAHNLNIIKTLCSAKIVAIRPMIYNNYVYLKSVVISDNP